MGEKVGFTNCVFEKLCFTENTIVIVLSAKHSFSKAKTICWKNRKFIWKIVGCFWTWQNGVFWVCFFWGSNVIVVCFWCVWHSSRSVKNACFFPVLGLLWGGLFLSILGLEGLGVFVFLVFVFVFCVAFVSVLLLDCFWCWFLFCFCFCFFVVVFFGGFKGQARWPKGPPHLALNPPYFLFVFFGFGFCFFCFPFFVESPLVYPYPQNTRNSDHGLSFPSPETQTMVWVSCFPNKYRVWGGLSFGPSFSRTMVWLSSREGRNTGVGVDEWALICFFNRQKKLFSPLKKGIFCLFFSVSLCFSLAFFGASPP